MKSIFKPILLTLRSKKHALMAIILSILMAFLAILIPSLLIPGNSLKFQLSILRTNNIGLILLFSSLFGITIAMQSYASYKEKTQNNKLAVKGTGTGVVAFTGALFSAKLCPVCLGAILGYLGIGSSVVFFLFFYETEILIASILILALITLLTSRRIARIKGL